MSHEPEPLEPEPDPAADTDAAWRRIVENYGERPELDPQTEPDEPAYASYDAPEHEIPDAESVEDRFVPPPAPPVPRASTDRFLAYLGVFGAPAVLLLLVMLQIRPPEWVLLGLVAAFVGGFCYLVFRLPRGPRDPGDDGAVV